MGFSIYTYDFWSYIFSKKLKDGLLFFNAQKAEKFADECNLCFKEAREITSDRYDKLKESLFAD